MSTTGLLYKHSILGYLLDQVAILTLELNGGMIKF